MSVTDLQVLGEIQDLLIETNNSGATWSSGLWTVAEVTAALNNRQYQFLKETGAVLKRASIPTNPLVFRHTLPSDWMATNRVVWQTSDATPTFTELPRSDSFEADHLMPTWPYNTAAAPQEYTDGQVPTLEMETFPAANVAGSLQLLYTALSTALSNSGAAFTVPDEFTPAIKWGMIADMLGKVGRGQDPGRAQYAELRYREGVEAAKLLLSGWD